MGASTKVATARPIDKQTPRIRNNKNHDRKQKTEALTCTAAMINK